MNDKGKLSSSIPSYEEEKYEKISEEYLKMFGDYISTFEFDNNLEKVIKTMELAIRTNKPYISTLEGTNYIN